MMEDHQPLTGLEVLDLTTMISGGFANVMLGDFGADVVSVEHPTQADPLRDWTPTAEGESLWAKSLGRNKRQITLDLSTEEGQILAQELAADRDVVIENFRPGTLEQWNLGYEELKELNEELIMVRISGYGQTGPHAEYPGFGTIAESISTFAHRNGFPDSDPLLPPIPLADYMAALFAIQGTLFALYERDILGSGEGQVVDVSLYEPLFRLCVPSVEAYDLNEEVANRTGNISTDAAPRNLYETSDGYISLSASSQRIFENVMHAIGQSDLIDDPRFETNEKRLENREELDTIIEEWTREHTQEAAIQEMREHDAIVGPIYDISDVFEDEHYTARDDIVEVTDDDLGTVRTTAPIPKFSRTPGKVDSLASEKGAANEDVYLKELGLSKDELNWLEDENVI
jgi:crotonobetainyl-CoA:carnitine CoA-transferase CaiB-like acyl-CoA transferase